MAKLFLLRHLKSQWNVENRFAGWVDNPLSPEGILQAQGIAEKLASERIDTIYASPLLRNKETIVRVFEYIPNAHPLFVSTDGGRTQRWENFIGTDHDMPVYVSEKLNERYYGKLQGLNKDEVVEKYGIDQVHQWHRGWSVRPPGGESLKDVYARAVPFFKNNIEKSLAEGKSVLVVASHNSLRAIVKYIERVSDTDIENVELPFGSLQSYEYNGKFTKLQL